MQLNPSILFASATLFLAVQGLRCNNSPEDGDCYWVGSAPNCGSTKFQIYEVDQWDMLLETTEDMNERKLMKNGRITRSCYNAYGNMCFSGYKRLWCSKY
ncbi:hypothetical protein P168DRAFT_321751 [Aspergillus campestris IBT 28561]|uniref:Uncharacterized protein n=1 Tax=Aspergillus campestris (strain IBT 28561) TaxID=1392248 RepID=A0A2I1CST8_ASPC2|nr:uncharacterized protein P168DRAFT_321751 [Aspergillus campestris IBT 28561]PKY00681.1 hypothetical protein P168DRAFT_321751 [Aspergillus campestris IBT 28561]